LEPEKATRIKKFIDRMKNEEDCLKDLKKEEIKLILYKTGNKYSINGTEHMIKAWYYPAVLQVN
jgi:hypothetical protein